MICDRTRTIAIVGGGFSGTALAIRLLGLPGASRLRIVLIEATGDPGPGLAYRTAPYPYLLNVPVARMSLDEHQPDDFLDFARCRLPAVAAGDYLPRALYGDYLRTRLSEAAARRRDGGSFEILTGTVVGTTARDRGGYRLRFADGGELGADEVVLATGTPVARHLPELAAVRSDPRYRHDPWQPAPEPDPAAPPLVIGTGLTMVDFACAWHDAHPDRPLHALSRHGLLPLPQSAGTAAGFDPGPLGSPLAAALTCRELMAAVRAAADTAADWRDVITHVRHRLPELWQRFPLVERRRFLRHVRTYWDIHRHRLPPAVDATLAELRARGLLVLHAGRLRAVATNARTLAVTFRPRGVPREQVLEVSALINCTGPDYAAGPGGTALGASLLDAGLACPEGTGSGWRTGPFGELVDRDGREAPGLYYLGPLLRGRDWEATAVGELREHATRLAVRLAAAQ
jgi:uncharacterized NAD(P)/FAD-binding protein YdhS